MELSRVKDLLEALSYLVTVLGFPIAASLFWIELRRGRREREHEAFSTLSQEYSRYIAMCLDQPELDVFEWQEEGHPQDGITRKERMMTTYLISLFERAYLMYRDQAPAFRRRQWSGWEAYIDEWCSRAEFRRAWERYGQMFDTDFTAYLGSRVRLAEALASSVSPAAAPPGDARVAER